MKRLMAGTDMRIQGDKMVALQVFWVDGPAGSAGAPSQAMPSDAVLLWIY